MTDFLSGLKSFTGRPASPSTRTRSRRGEKLQRTTDSEIAVQRPDRLRSTPVGAGEGLALWYDGKTMTLACKASNTFKTIPAPPMLDAAIDNMRKQFKIDAPGADLLYSHPYAILMEQVKRAASSGARPSAGCAANHLAFEGDEVDWQIWIHDGPQPVPLRFVITTKTVKATRSSRSSSRTGRRGRPYPIRPSSFSRRPARRPSPRSPPRAARPGSRKESACVPNES